MKERINQLIKALGLSGRSFSSKIGKSSAFASTIGDNVGADVLINILNIFPQVNPQWLLMGEGEMFKPEKETVFYEENASFTIAATPNAEYGEENYKDLYISELKGRICLLEKLLAEKDKIIQEKDVLLQSFKEGILVYVKK